MVTPRITLIHRDALMAKQKLIYDTLIAAGRSNNPSGKLSVSEAQALRDQFMYSFTNVLSPGDENYSFFVDSSRP